MVEIRNPARERLERGELSLGFTVSLGRTITIAGLAKGAGFDWMFLEMEHGSLPLETAAQIGQMGRAIGIAPIPRVPPVTTATLLIVPLPVVSCPRARSWRPAVNSVILIAALVSSLWPAESAVRGRLVEALEYE